MAVPDMPLIIRHLGRCAYQDTFERMKQVTQERNEQSPDELWLLEHDPVFTQGVAGKEEHILMPGDIPVVQSDRGGDVTYHGPGQITAYFLIDLRRIGLGVRELVTLIEQCMVDTLAHWGIEASPRSDAPGVYISSGEKIGSLGLRIRKGCSYHGLNFNVDMDLRPWQRINACGLGVVMTQMSNLLENPPGIDTVAKQLAAISALKLGYNRQNVEYKHPKLS